MTTPLKYSNLLQKAAGNLPENSPKPSFDNACRQVCLLLTLLLALLGLTACVPVTRPPAPEAHAAGTPTPAALPPQVRIHLPDSRLIYPGDNVTITVEMILPELLQPAPAEGEQGAALRLAIDGADTGWRTVAQLGGTRLDYHWIAGMPDSYELVAQARTGAGLVGEAHRYIVVLPPPDPNIGQSATLRATHVTLPAYPLEAFQRAQVDPVYLWPYQAFDREAFWASAPQPTPQQFDLLILENRYLQISILPQLGGRIWQVIHKPTGNAMFYQNTVVKPSPWGPANQLGWLGLGGLEWALPVNEHGYDWGTAWEVTTFQDATGAVGVELATPDDGRLLAATITVTLHPDRADFTVAPTLHNGAAHGLDFHFWQTAMLAPGGANHPSADLRFLTPATLARIHSTGDRLLPAPGELITWPIYFGRDLSRLGNWDDYIGLFESPAAHGPYVGVYDPVADVGAIRIFPADVAQGAKIFGLGWRRPIGSEHFTDDDSAYVELHGGLSANFDDPYQLAAGASVGWQETWYPPVGIGGVVYANGELALNVTRQAQGVQIGLYPTTALVGTLIVSDTQGTEARLPLTLDPTTPFVADLAGFAPTAAVTVQVVDSRGVTRLAYQAAGGLAGELWRSQSPAAAVLGAAAARPAGHLRVAPVAP
jgi:hypothetical protein